MQKRWFSILSVAFAVLILVVMHSLPHHHHGEALCFVTVCSEDGHHGAAAGECSHHHSDQTEPCDTCTVEDSYLFSFGQNDTKCKVASCHQDYHPHIHLFPASGLATVMLLYEATPVDEPLEHGEFHACFYRSVNASRDNGLRAPPHLTV